MNLYCPISPATDRLFGGVKELKQSIVDTIRKAREKKGLTQDDLNAVALLGCDVPTCQEYEADPLKLTSFAMGRAQFPLDVAWEEMVRVSDEMLERHEEILTAAFKEDARWKQAPAKHINQKPPADVLRFFTVQLLSDELNVLDHGIPELDSSDGK